MRVSPSSLPAGERPGFIGDELVSSLKLLSGKRFKHDENIRRTAYSYTLTEGADDWKRGGELTPLRCEGFALKNRAIQIRKGPYRERIVIPAYIQMSGEHPDYSREEYGGYAVWKGKLTLIETHTHIPEMAGSFFAFSDDEGSTWQNSRGYLVGFFQDGYMGHVTGDEPDVVELKDGRLMTYLRSTGGRILKSYSSDGGELWTKVAFTDLAMSNSPCALERLPVSGDFVLVWNQMSADEICRGFRRGRLTVAISRDDGGTWINRKNLALSPGCTPATHIEPPPHTAMVRGPSGRRNHMGEIPDGFTHYHYPEIYFSDDNESVMIYYNVGNPDGTLAPKLKEFPVTWLYES